MTGTYLLISDGVSMSRQQLLRWLDRQPRVVDWHASQVDNLVAVVWDGPMASLRTALQRDAGLATFVLVDAATSGWDGLLARATWDFIRSAPAIGGRPAVVAPSPEAVGH